MINTILFDLDGTLTPMSGDDFVQSYFKYLTKHFSKMGYNPKELVMWVWAGTKKMMENDGSKTNYEAFWDEVEKISGKDIKKDIPLFDAFYLNEFDNVKELMPKDYSLRDFFDKLKSMGFKLVLATNPFFPYNAAVTRLAWLGLSVEDFSYISIMENSKYTKPNLLYYQEIFDKIGEKPENCLMVGNNPVEDMCVSALGSKVFFMPQYEENKENIDCSHFPQGDFDNLLKFISENIE